MPVFPAPPQVLVPYVYLTAKSSDMAKLVETIPREGQQTTTDDFMYSFDTTAQVAPTSSSPAAVTATLTDMFSHLPVVLADVATVVGNAVYQRVRANVLAAGRYRLVVHYNASGTSNLFDLAYEINVPW